MASISKLSIRGVRSFSPDDAEQVLEFYFPCTIIVGANGCGKTTIIESLTFAACGAMPPGNKSGQAFVHDPRSLGQNVVKANVKLRFTGRAGNSMVVVRSMEVQQKKTTLTFKQLDGVLRGTDKSGNRVSMGHKCTELDRQLPLLLGVSKAILEHVVFCHQEDSSWPLQEGAVLKKRFDDIFDSTRYSKALEVFSKLKKEYTAKVKDLKVDVAGISSHRFAAKGFRQELSKYSEQIEQVEEEITEQKEALKETEEEQTRLDNILQQITETKMELECRKNDYNTECEVMKKQSSMLQDDLTQLHSVSELKEMLREFDAQRTQQLEQKADLEAEINSAKKDLLRIEKQDKDLESRVGRLQEKKDMHEKRLRARFDKMVEMGETFALGDVLSQITQSQTQTQTQPQHTQTLNSSYSANYSVLDVSVAPHNQASPILDIPEKHMDEFYRAASKKEEELTQAVEDHKSAHAKAESELANQLSDIKAKMTSIETSRTQLNKTQAEAREELKTIGNQLQRTTRIGASDLEDARQHAARYAKERDQVNSDPRKNEIPLEIRDLETKIDAIKRDLEDDRLALDQLRQSADTQNAVSVLRGQVVKELESLEELIKDSAYIAQSFNISSFPKNVPGMEEMGKHGEHLRDVIEQVVDEVTGRNDGQNLELEKANAITVKLQQGVSERRALLSHDQRAVNSKRARMTQLEGAIEAVKVVVKDMTAYEKETRVATPMISEIHPQELLAYINDRLAEEESQSVEGIQAEVVYKIFKKLMKQAKTNDGKYVCPCCVRDFQNPDEFATLKAQLKMLSSEQSPLLELDEQNMVSRSNYSRWKDAVAEHSHAILEYRRIADEVNDLETSIKALEDGLSESTRQLNDAKESASDIETQVASLRELLDSSKRWAEAAARIAEKRMQVNQKEVDLSISTGVDTKGRDLTAVERDMQDRQEAREKYTNKMNRLNKEFSALMNRINAITNQAAETEKTFRAKEAKMAEEQKSIQRKHDLGEVVASCATEERKLQDELAPLAQRRKSKETEISRLKALASEDEERLRSTKESFASALKELLNIGRQIEEYQSSTAEDELANVERKKAEFAKQTKEKNLQLSALQPQLERILKAVEDQQRHKKNLKENIELINSTQVIAQLKIDIAKLEEKAQTVEGHETVYDDVASLRKRKEGILKASARLEGRRGEILESIRSIKRKLSAPEYKEVDEEYRIAMIKYETTQMAVKDLEKYHAALDKALLKFHSIKIEEINKIILDLWNLTYKGEDITGIQIVSGQESGSRATRSYNYRVVMTKGSTELDMRGRCSAGQRVLASIVIRLALAETFCLNFGCIALDEPTVNLDFNNKRGLAIALAQIIASRAKQSNFQLILITHDEDFVSMMKTELSSQTGFQMPEKYFQVRREEGADGKFYSKIDAIDWEELT